MRKGLVLLPMLLLASCSEYQAGFTAIQKQSITASQNVADDVGSTWKAGGCAITFGAAMRDPVLKSVLPVLCDPSKLNIPSPVVSQ